jgi:hypothetical protein
MKQYFNFDLTPELAQRLKACYDEQQAIYDLMLVGTSTDDLVGGIPMGTGPVAKYCFKACDLAPKYPEYIGLKAGFTLAQFQSNSKFSKFWTDTNNQRTTIDNQKLAIDGLSGRAMTSKANHFHTKMETDKNVSSVKVDYDDLHSLFSNKAELAKETKKNNKALKEAAAIIEANKKNMPQ